MFLREQFCFPSLFPTVEAPVQKPIHFSLSSRSIFSPPFRHCFSADSGSLIVLVIHIIKNYAEVFALSYGDTELQQEHVLPELDSWLSQLVEPYNCSQEICSLFA